MEQYPIRASFAALGLVIVLTGVGLSRDAALGAGFTAAPVSAHGPVKPWRTYRNTHKGYTLRYPSSWTVNERSAADGSLTTVFAPRHGGGNITVTVIPAGPDGPQISDVPNGHCQPITNDSGLAGMRCFDTLSFNTYTVYFGPSATYRISTTQRSSKVYERLVQSFRLLSG